MKFNFFNLSYLLVIMSACSSYTVDLDQGGSAVKIVSKLPFKASCRELGEVYGMGKDKADDLIAIVKSARNDLRNNTSEIGGNFVTLETNNTVQFSGSAEVVLGGMAFRCEPLKEKPNETKN